MKGYIKGFTKENLKAHKRENIRLRTAGAKKAALEAVKGGKPKSFGTSNMEHRRELMGKATTLERMRKHDEK